LHPNHSKKRFCFMKKLLKFLLYAVLSIVALVVVLGLFAKKDYHIERSIEIDAPQAMIYDYIRHFKNFDQWSPWTALDPEMTSTVSGTDGEVGALHSWKGNKKVGEGRQTITALAPDRIDIKTEFLEPYAGTSPTWFKLEPAGKKIKVSWAFDMHTPFPLNGLMMFTDVDAGVGKDYEMGLENLQRILEEMAHRKYRGFEVTIDETFPVRNYYGIRQTTDSSSYRKIFTGGLAKSIAVFEKSGVKPTGPAATLFWTRAGVKTDFTVGLPAAPGVVPAGLSAVETGGRKAYIIDYYGAYEGAGRAHGAMEEFMAANNLSSVPPAIEEYLVTPATEKDTSKWLTKVIYFAEPQK
jgi:hypothetical protein